MKYFPPIMLMEEYFKELNSKRDNLLKELHEIEMMLDWGSVDREAHQPSGSSDYDTIQRYRWMKYQAFKSRLLKSMGRLKEVSRKRNNQVMEEANEFLKKFDETYNCTHLEDTGRPSYFQINYGNPPYFQII
ncbi:MAG: hypothetical protein EOO43_10960 [Flavobacterium sp.]|nr:MAG: hypothetical protein EOO43_10960 [Flavobacterium sp.]